MTDSHLEAVAEAICKSCGRTWDSQRDPEMYMYYRRVASNALAALGLTEEERTVYDHAEPYSTGYEHRLVSPWIRAEDA